MGIITDLILLPFRIVEAAFKLIVSTLEAMMKLVTGLINVTFAFAEATVKICLFVVLLPFRILEALLPPYGGSGGGSSNSRKGRAK